MSLTEVKTMAERMLATRMNDMAKIKVKCWLFHSESRAQNNNEPFTFENHSRSLGKEDYLRHIHGDLIDCQDIGGKEKATQVVEKWFAR